MHCTKCGTSIPEGAAFCPGCGAPVASGAAASPRPATSTAPGTRDGAAKPKKKLGCLGWIGIAVVVLIVLGVIGSNSKEPAGEQAASTPPPGAPAQPVKPPLAVTATQLFNAYQGNEAAAQNAYGDRSLLVSGTVDKVDLDFMDKPRVLLKTPNQFMSAQAGLASDAEASASSLRPGQKVTLLCEGVSEVVATPMLKECRLQP